MGAGVDHGERMVIGLGKGDCEMKIRRCGNIVREYGKYM